LETDFPDLFRRAQALLKKCGAQISDDEFSRELGVIIYPAKLLQNDNEYRKLVQTFCEDASVASVALDKVKSKLDKLDALPLNECFSFMAIFFHPQKVFYAPGISWVSPQKVFEAIDEASELLDNIRRWMSFVTDGPGKKKGRGQPPIPCWRETLMLLKIWEKLTGRPVVTPKEEGYQPSTEFIRLCLSMIIPNITLANVHTLIKRVRKFEARSKSIYTAPRASSST
jgi:hypothetical protein